MPTFTLDDVKQAIQEIKLDGYIVTEDNLLDVLRNKEDYELDKRESYELRQRENQEREVDQAVYDNQCSHD